jgi:hypothetical protein
MSTDSVRLRSTGSPTALAEAGSDGVSVEGGYSHSENAPLGNKLRDNRSDPAATLENRLIRAAAARTSRRKKPRTGKKRTRKKLKPIASNDFGVEVGGHSSFDILDRRIDHGLIVVSRETLPDGRVRTTYRNVLP